ncbi:MAG: YggT family protein [Nitrincola lacisaponensis]|uniref:Integral membrane protein YggT, involved in response to extracytoplasmic stress (Osmotic shock) n=1 Tax=Nitrincola lacisaponensis TaxID=267850 RepID=A0A063Y1C9_9GAMM|nr:YggT family protein [Nitrincola lacisaponensis]KDE40133.1 Integral membrane protein YggT, involved in response to extracytoplasmic stress (osmotic shock) [Nitrincola lacisaponensis]
MDPLLLIIRTIGEMFAFIVILRFLLQAMNVDYYNPISQAVVKITQPPLIPMQRIVPRVGRLDLSPLLLAFLVKLGTLFLLVSMTSSRLDTAAIIMLSVVGVLDTLLTILFWSTIGSVIISWVAPNSPHPAPQLLQQLVEPLFAQVRRVIPPIGGLDLSPIAIFLVIQIIQSQLPRLM